MDDERALTLRQVAERCQLPYSTVFTHAPPHRLPAAWLARMAGPAFPTC
jgi:hypothetical protein